jgi:hypothetical protein
MQLVQIKSIRKYTAENFAKIYLLFQNVLVNTNDVSLLKWILSESQRVKLNRRYYKKKSYVVVSLTQACNLFFFVSVREEQVELGVEIITFF